jgi:hypothetical protein
MEWVRRGCVITIASTEQDGSEVITIWEVYQRVHSVCLQQQGAACCRCPFHISCKIEGNVCQNGTYNSKCPILFREGNQNPELL